MREGNKGDHHQLVFRCVCMHERLASDLVVEEDMLCARGAGGTSKSKADDIACSA